MDPERFASLTLEELSMRIIDLGRHLLLLEYKSVFGHQSDYVLVEVDLGPRLYSVQTG